MTENKVMFDRPVAGHLVVRLANGEEFIPSEQDMERFGYTLKVAAYDAFRIQLARALDKIEGTANESGINAELNPVRYLAEWAIMHRHVHPFEAESRDRVAQLEHDLRSHRYQPRVRLKS